MHEMNTTKKEIDEKGYLEIETKSDLKHASYIRAHKEWLTKYFKPNHLSC